MPPVGFEPTVSAGERAVDLRHRPRGHWDRHGFRLYYYYYYCIDLFVYVLCPVFCPVLFEFACSALSVLERLGVRMNKLIYHKGNTFNYTLVIFVI